jgi:hypothetical protein
MASRKGAEPKLTLATPSRASSVTEGELDHRFVRSPVAGLKVSALRDPDVARDTLHDAEHVGSADTLAVRISL